jgi:hypothetical protein
LPSYQNLWVQIEKKITSAGVRPAQSRASKNYSGMNRMLDSKFKFATKNRRNDNCEFKLIKSDFIPYCILFVIQYSTSIHHLEKLILCYCSWAIIKSPCIISSEHIGKLKLVNNSCMHYLEINLTISIWLAFFTSKMYVLLEYLPNGSHQFSPQHNTTQHNTTQHNTTQHNTTQHWLNIINWSWNR